MPLPSRYILFLIGLLTLGTAKAEDRYPTRAIRWVVPYLAGTSPDRTVRVVAEALSVALKQPVVVDNKPGAAGNLGAALAAKAPADGYTWVYSGSPMSASMRMYKSPGFDVMRDFTHIGQIGTSETTVVTSPGSDITSISDLLARLRKDPGKASFASGGIGSPAHLGAELMLNAANVQALHVPYKGATESVNAVVGRQVDFALAITSVALPLIQSGKLTALAVTSPTRNPKLAGVPTLVEAGLPVTLISFGGLSVPAGTPLPVVAKITDALNRVLGLPDVQMKLESMGGQVAPSTPTQYTQALRTEIGQVEKMMKAARLEPQ